MGIVNVTPDSFSDGGHFLDHAAAIDHARQLVEQGADLLDIGGESTRPYATPVDTDEELDRVIPVLREVCPRVSVPVSVDTSKAAVARAAIAVGVEIINDVTGLEGDPQMLEVARESRAGLCVMHMQGTPQTMQVAPAYDDVVREVAAYLQRRCETLIELGISADRLCVDPGIGFGKTHAHNLTLLARCGYFHRLQAPLLVGHSRKGVLAKVLGDGNVDRTAATVGVALSLAGQGVQIIRVHDVAPLRHALLLFEATGGIDGQVATFDDCRA
jgi:dihydropteroate synthase